MNAVINSIVRTNFFVIINSTIKQYQDELFGPILPILNVNSADEVFFFLILKNLNKMEIVSINFFSTLTVYHFPQSSV